MRTPNWNCGARFLACAGMLTMSGLLLAGETTMKKPNVILCMTDDQGWGDTGYNGHPFLKTPNLDEMAASGIRFNRFYSGAPVCSPTRGSAITGRHPYRYGITFANTGHMPREEITLVEALKTRGYTTGHFGKWHLGTLTTEIRDSNRGRPGDATHYSPPWQNGFDVCFSTEAKVPTWDPMKKPGTNAPYGTHYFNTDGSVETENLEGDDSRVIMDRVVPFIRGAVKQDRPFLAVVWFHTPHLPCVAGPKYRKMYEGVPGANPAYHGCVTAMDEQVGRLRAELRRLGVQRNTMLWFCSDNGPEGAAGKAPGSAGPLRGRKRSLFEGGVRVPGILVWPAKIRAPRVVDVPCSTSDYFPTILDVLGLKLEGQPEPIDGVSLLPLIEGKMTRRPRPIGFQSGRQVSLIDNRYKLIKSGGGRKKRKGPPATDGFMLFDLVDDPGETKDLAAERPEIVEAMKKTLTKWQASCRASAAGKDYE
ncbi:MAG: sulfatase family protein [Planctomycetota bacterium]|jgi:arylsulfatase A-like enzyme